MSEQNVNTVRASYDAYARGEFAAVLAAMDPGIEWADQDSLPWGGTHRGHEAFANHMQTFTGHFEEVRIEPQEYLDAGEHVVVTGRLSGRAQAGAFNVPTVWIWQLRDGKTTRVDTYTDTAAVLGALGR
jgi:ketosteroid isomerase-like protein